MNTSAEPTATGGMPLATSNCDVCSVVRDPGGVAIHFGELRPSAMDPRATEVALRHRVALGEGAAGRLQELMSALLNESAVPQDSPR